VLDNGTGAITGQALQGGRTGSLWRAVLAPVARLGVDSVVEPEQDGGPTPLVPPVWRARFNFNQLERGLWPQRTTLSPTPTTMAVAADLIAGVAVWRCRRYELANLSGMIPRGNQTDRRRSLRP